MFGKLMQVLGLVGDVEKNKHNMIWMMKVLLKHMLLVKI